MEKIKQQAFTEKLEILQLCLNSNKHMQTKKTITQASHEGNKCHKNVGRKKMKIQFMKLLEKRNEEVYALLIQRINSVYMQHNIIQAMSPNCPHSSLHQIAKSSSRHKKEFAQLQNRIRQTNQHLIQQLLTQQTTIHLQNDKESVLQVYEKKLEDMMRVLFGKENDIVSQHVGILQGKLSYREFRNLDSHFMEISNVFAMTHKIRKFQQEIKHLEQRRQALKQIQNTNNTNNTNSQTPSVLTCSSSSSQKQNTPSKISSSSSQSCPEASPHIGPSSPLFLQQFSQRYTFNDPFFRRILRIYKQEKHRQEELNKQYQEILDKYKEVNKQHEKLVEKYKGQGKKNGI